MTVHHMPIAPLSIDLQLLLPLAANTCLVEQQPHEKALMGPYVSCNEVQCSVSTPYVSSSQLWPPFARQLIFTITLMSCFPTTDSFRDDWHEVAKELQSL